MELLDSNAGTTGRALIGLDPAVPGAVPQRLFVKLPPLDEQQRLFVTSSGMGRRESLFYQHLGKEVPVRVPRCFFAQSNVQGDRYVMLLEYLPDGGCEFRNASRHYSPDYVRRVLASFARLHAQYWQSPRFSQDLDWLQEPLQHDIAVQLIDEALRRHREEMPAVFAQMAECYLAHTDDVHAQWAQGCHTLIHGDVHDGNLFMDKQEPGFLDWALVARGPAMRDVGYFLAGTLAPEHRQLAPGLLQEYRGALIQLGAVAPSMDELWLQYRRHVAYVWVGAVTTLAMGDAWQPPGYTLSALERIHAVMEAVDTVTAFK
jgi:thiamine kinase-like enzyme